ncbi:zinc metallopeptidase [Flavobacterium sp. F372]|jgi:Zn-dependent membrane protease YugP|uniref:Zinc metallopeptidase n=1 Tax=Flavobacterium bernardetii TaxID=2813823 RepID=A0ABR7IZ86_9FLAO|nr:zinc metallopeptidase [Flavobacterium bernardetii]MBC5835116.1 zinc metallopeptidase [Flavobacterium bernardetii]NHF70768.1 zinc metallopeptidase [Flavobacterium bernardetii]
MFDLPYMIIIGVIALFSWLVSSRLKSKFEHYSKLTLRNGMSGAEIAEKMLADHGISDVKVISTPGRLTDHYNPTDKTVNLSEAVYNQRNAAAAAVAAHEVGHAVQHAQAYEWLTMRSKMVPMVNVSSSMSQWLIMGGIILGFASKSGIGFYVAVAGLALMAVATAFSFITLPVEYDASNRALAWLKNKNMLGQEEYAGAEDSLKWAARTYLVAALGALASLLYWAYRILGSRD